MATTRKDALISADCISKELGLIIDLSTAAVVDGSSTDMQGSNRVLMSVVGIKKTGAGPKSLQIVGSASADLSNPVVIKTYGGAVASADNDVIRLEVRADSIKAAGDAESTPVELRYVGAKVGMDNAADIGVLTILQDKPAVQKNGNTTNIIGGAAVEMA